MTSYETLSELIGKYCDGSGRVLLPRGVLIDYLASNGVVVQKHGYWKTYVVETEFGEMRFPMCSVCGEVEHIAKPYCPYCGAKMDGGT